MAKKAKVLFAIIIFFGISTLVINISLAGTVGNTATVADPKGEGVFSLKKNRNFAIKVGVDTEFVFDRDLKASDASSAQFSEAQWYMGKIGCVLFNRVEPYVKFGYAHMVAKWNEVGADAKLESNTGFAWSLGSKVLVWDFEKPNLRLIADGYYRIADLNAEQGFYDGRTLAIEPGSSRFFIREWQISLIAATDIEVSTMSKGSDFLGVTRIVPYAGVKYSDISGRLRTIWQGNSNYNNPGKIESKHKFGIVAGCDFVGPNSISVNLEGRFIDETALTAGLQMLL